MAGHEGGCTYWQMARDTLIQHPPRRHCAPLHQHIAQCGPSVTGPVHNPPTSRQNTLTCRQNYIDTDAQIVVRKVHNPANLDFPCTTDTQEVSRPAILNGISPTANVPAQSASPFHM
uniref:Uncharacterized protein n=1 Tax=Eutreptiella gymnastica TaxID=73025 RepID=A0A7S4G1E4_9EUGL